MLFRVSVACRRAILPLLTTGLTLAGCGGADSSSTSSKDLKTFDVEEAPARTTTTRREWSVGGIVSGKSETSISEPAGAPAEAPPPPPPPPAQSNLLTAGDYDDLLNPDLYAKYAGRFLQGHGGDLPFVDTRTRVAIKVVDRSGQPIPFARVSVSRAGGPLQLLTAAGGIGSVYPKYDRLPAQSRVQISSGVARATKALDLSANGPRQVTVTLPNTTKAVSAMDLALVLDTTGSMGDEMSYLQTELDAIVARLKRDAGNLDLRIGVVLYRDEGDEYVVKSAPLTGDIGTVRATLARQSADGGGDTPEAVHLALAAAERLQWRPEAAKALLFVADAPPHDEDVAAALTSTERLRARGVQIVPVAASGVEDTAQYLMRTMAALTQGRYIFLTDDSGVGDPHAEPDVDCYVVTRLGQVIARVLAGFVQGRRIEPTQGEVIRTVGDYDRGRCSNDGTSSQEDADPVRKPTLKLLLSALPLLALAPASTPASAAALPLSSTETMAIERVRTVGRQLFDYDQAASVSTDALLAKVPPERLNTVRGWVVEPGADGTLVATYYSGDGAAHRAVFAATIAAGKVTGSRLAADDAASALTPGQERLAAALATARSHAEAKGWQPCTPARFNTVALPPATPDAPVSVYLLTAQVRASELPFGGHYRLDVDRDGRVVGERPFTKACLTMPRPGPGAVGLIVTHSLDPTPTEVHVFTSLVAQLPVFVATANERSWQVDGASITLMRKDQR